jgi:electron transfer flavoprotein alpha subunit
MGILVVAEQSGGSVKKSAYASITFARQVAQRQGLSYDLVILGPGAGTAAQALGEYGAARVYTVDDPSLENYLAMPYAAAIASVAKESGAQWVVSTSTTTGKDVLPRVAVKLDAGLASDVI